MSWKDFLLWKRSLRESKECIKEWLPSFASYYDEKKKNVRGTYDKWWATWLCNTGKDEVLGAMVDRLASQAEHEYDTVIDKDEVFSSIISNPAGQSGRK